MLLHLTHSSPKIVRLHRLRLALHAFLFLFSILLLIIASVTLAYSLRVYESVGLHAVPELVSAGALGLVLVGLGWWPRGKDKWGVWLMGRVAGEVVWMFLLSLCLFGGVTSLHESTPGLLTTCGNFFICKGYIAILVFSWLAWLAAVTSFALLFTSALYQTIRRKRSGVWSQDIARWEWYWPDEGTRNGRRATAAFGSSERDVEAAKGDPFAAEEPRVVYPRLAARDPMVRDTDGFVLPPEHLAPDAQPIPSGMNRAEFQTHVLGDDPVDFGHASTAAGKGQHDDWAGPTAM